MEFPVDVLETTRYQELECSAHTYMNELLYSDPDQPHQLTLSSGKKVQISLSNVGFVPLFGANVQHKVLALFTPQDQFTAVALFLDNQWFAVEEILKTASSTREGLVKVRSVGERIVLYVLNRIVYRTREATKGEVPFLCHGENDYAKILWKDGEAVGFYSVKSAGSICNNSLRQLYILPVMDSIFVRKAHRGKDHGLQMLEDFVDSFEETQLGLKYPLTPAMASVCRRYLDRYPADVDLLWEVEGVGGPYQRTRIANKLAAWPMNADIYKGEHGEDNDKNEELKEEERTKEDADLNIADEAVIAKECLKGAQEISAPISARTRSSEHRLRKRTRDEVEENGMVSRPEKINRMEMVGDEAVPSDGNGDDSAAPEVVELNGKQSLGQKGEKAGAEKEAESFVNGTDREEEEMELEKDAVEHYSIVLEDTNDAVSVVELDVMAEVQQGEESLPEKEEMAEEKQEGASFAVEIPAVEEKQDVTIAEMEKQTCLGVQEQNESPPTVAEKAAGPEAGEIEGASAVKEKAAAPEAKELEGATTVEERGAAPEDEEIVGVTAVEERGAAPEAEDIEGATAVEEGGAAPEALKGKETAPEAVAREAAALVEKEEEVTPAAEEKQASPITEEKQIVQIAEQQHPISSFSEKVKGFAPFNKEIEVSDKVINVPPVIQEEKKGVPALEETSEGEKEPDQDIDAANDVDKEMMHTSDLLPEVSQTLVEREYEQEHRSKVPDIPSLEEAKTRTASRGLGKVDSLQDVEEGPKVETVKDIKDAGAAEEKVTTEEEHSSVEEEQDDDPPVIHRRVLRRNTKASQARLRSRAKRGNKI